MVHTLLLAFSAPFVCFILLHILSFPPIGVTRANDHVQGHPWGLVDIQSKQTTRTTQL